MQFMNTGIALRKRRRQNRAGWDGLKPFHPALLGKEEGRSETEQAVKLMVQQPIQVTFIF